MDRMPPLKGVVTVTQERVPQQQSPKGMRPRGLSERMGHGNNTLERRHSPSSVKLSHDFFKIIAAFFETVKHVK